ncbi:MAG: TolC family protein [Vicinamibacterales bacterium]
MRACLIGSMVIGAIVSAPILARPAGAQPPPAAAPPIGIVSAVQSTLERHPLLEVQRQQVAASRAILRQRTGAFDTVVEWAGTERRTRTPLTESETAGLPLTSLVENAFAVDASAQRLLRSGVVIGPSLSVNRATDNLQPNGLNRARLSFDVTVPLLRGRGEAIVAGPEAAAAIDVEASQLALGQQAADLVLSTATSYWQYVAARRQLEIVTQSEARGQQYVDAVTALADADRLPRSEVNQARANFDSRAAGRFLLEQRVVEARAALALAMGLPPDAIATLPAPADAFPDGLTDGAAVERPETTQVLTGVALARRADYLAADKARTSADLLRRVAANAVRPQMDLTFSTGYSSLREGRGAGDLLGAPFAGAAGPDALVGLRWTRPLANNTAAGQRAEAEAIYQQAAWLRTERGRVITVEVSNAVAALQNGRRRLGRASEAVKGFQAALDGEQDKLRLGVGSLTDLLTVEGRPTEALLDLVDAQQAYAIGLAQLRHASGTLIDATAPAPPARDVFFRPPADAPGLQ